MARRKKARTTPFQADQRKLPGIFAEGGCGVSKGSCDEGRTCGDAAAKQFFLYEIVARIVVIYLCIYCSRELWYALVERKIAYWNDDFIDRLLVDWSRVVVHRDTTPVRYWILIGLWIICVVGCLGIAILGGGGQAPEHPRMAFLAAVVACLRGGWLEVR